MAHGPPVVKLMLRTYFDHESGNMSNLIADMGAPGHPAAFIDPVAGQEKRDTRILKELGVTVVYILETHVPVNYKSGTPELKKRFPGAKSVLSKASGGKADVLVEGGEIFHLGKLEVKVLATPGHTKGCVTYVTGHGPGQFYPPFAFTGHSLLIRGKGDTDHQGGDAEELSKSVHTQIFTLHRNTHIVPGHDFLRVGQTATTVREEKEYNPFFKIE